jgi:hypothetical protein
MGRRRKNPRGLVVEALTSLPGKHQRTAHLPPHDLPPEEFVEIGTGEDTSGIVANPGHTILGLAVWAGWIVWTVQLWFFSNAPFTDLFIAAGIWLFAFVVTIFGIPAMRRAARNRVRT